MGLVTLLFGLLNMPAVQEYAKDFAVKELKAKLGTELGIGKLSFQPFNTVQLDSVYLYDQSNQKILVADKVSASIDLFALAKSKIVINSAWLSDFEVHLSKKTPDAPLNIQYIIDAFKLQDDKPKSQLDIKLSSINISNGQFYYNVKDKPSKQNVFDENHIYVSNLNAKLALKSLLSDSLNIEVKKINLKEKSGLEITNLSFRLITQEKKAYLKGFRLDLPSSFLELEKCEVNLSTPADSVNVNMLDYANIDLIIAPSYIAPKDISAFAPLLQNFNDYVSLNGHISGTVDDIRMKDISMNLNDKVHLIYNAEIKDLRHPDKMYILGSINNLFVTNDGFKIILNNLSKNKADLPKQIANLGTISYQGDVSGYLDQLTIFGNLESQLGIIKTDILLAVDPSKNIDPHMRGKLYTSNFDLGKLLDNKDLGKTSLNLSVDLQLPKHNKLRGNAQGVISEFVYKGYEYKDITLDTNYDGMRVDGHLKVKTPNGDLFINGLFDLSDAKLPELNFEARANNIELDDLRILDKFKNSNLSFVLRANFKGSNIDDALGYLRIDSLDFVSEDKHFQMDQFLVEASKDSTFNKLSITSDIINGKVKGEYSFTTMANSVLQTLHPYLPALINLPQKKKPNEKKNDLTFDFQINNTESLSSILNLPVTVISTAKIIGFYNNMHDKFKVEVFTPSLKAGGTNIQSGYILAENQNNIINTKVNALIPGKNNSINDVSLTATASNNLVNTNITFFNDGKQKAKGEFAISTLFTRENKEPLQIDLNMLPSELVLNNAHWKMEKSHIHIQENIVGIDNFLVYNDDSNQEIKINGKYSKSNPKEILKTELKNIDLEYIFQTLAIDVLRFGGKATGSLFLSSIEKKPYANTSLDIEDFKFNGTDLGHFKLFSELDDETNKVILNGKIVSKENKTTSVDGTIDPIKQALSIKFDADSIDISFLNRFAETIFDNVSGRGTGKVHLFGDFSNVTVEGDAYIENGNIGISFLNTNYSFSDTIHLKKDLIYFNDITFIDDHNNRAIGTGKVAHDFFSNFMYYIDLSANKFMVYNATEKQNPLFFGKVFGSGKGTIGGDESAVNIDISMRTEENTTVRMNFMENSVNEYTFITYKDKDAHPDSLSTGTPTILAPIKNDSGMDINMNFYIDATPDAVVEVVMDPVGGDVLRGVGSGTMQFQWNSKASPRLYGTYKINRGSYNFTFQRLMERTFIIQDGSTVQFTGDPFEAILDVDAIYKVTASLNDLDRELALQFGQTTIPVNCILNLSGPLKHPNVKLDLSFPTTDPEVERQVKSFINTEDMINRQVTFLLLLSKFYTPDYANTDQRTSDFAAVASATLSNQLSKIVNQTDKRWQLGTNIRTSDAEFTTTEVELILSSQLLNDRLLLNGNFGYRDDPVIKKDAVIGDVDIEYLLNNSGSWRIKAYNHYNEKFYYTNNSSQTQGVGIMYKKDFDKLKDLFFKPTIRLHKKDSVKPITPDSLKKGSSLSPFIKIKE